MSRRFSRAALVVLIAALPFCGTPPKETPSKVASSSGLVVPVTELITKAVGTRLHDRLRRPAEQRAAYFDGTSPVRP